MTSRDTYEWGYPDNILGSLFECWWCLSLVVSLGLAVSASIFASLSLWYGILLWLASGAMAIFWERLTGRSKARW